MKRSAWLVLGLVALGCRSAPPPPPPAPAQVSVNLMRGFPEPLSEGASLQLVALLDATAAMRERDAGGVAHFEAARSSAARWHDALPPDAAVELRALGGARGASCANPARMLAGAEASRPVWRAALDAAVPAGDGSLAEAIFELAARLARPDPTPMRVVAWSALRDPCGASLCEAAWELTRRGGRLDLVVLGDAPVPGCLVEIEAPQARVPSVGPQPAVGFRVERTGPDPAVVGNSEAGALPVEFAPGSARVAVALEPPLVLERVFPAGGRLVLEIVDFPALDPPARHWRWRALAPEPAPRVAP